MYKAISTLALLFIGAVLIVTTLVVKAKYPNKVYNGFDRVILQANIVSPIGMMPTGDSIRAFSGATDSLFFFSTSDPGTMISTDHQLKHAKSIHLSLSRGLLDSLQDFFFTFVNYPFVHIYGHNLPAIISVGIPDGHTNIFSLPKGGYSQAIALSDSIFILRKVDTALADQQFIRVNTHSGIILKESRISELYHDGGMSTDGRLHYDATTGRLTYVYYYCNRFFSFDTTLQGATQHHTIDTFSHFRFELSEPTAKNDHVFTNQGPDMMSNGASCVYKGRLFVQSLLKGDHEKEADFHMSTPVDMYDVGTGNYKGSFYLPLNARDKISRMAIFDDILVVQCKEAVYAFRIHY
jgi:hypothetical protein